ncbi:transposable element Tcb1 transposase [Trichonephila clavipes]|nr:transposable element Tcb1 transposase [Trichonephila clavipes]
MNGGHGTEWNEIVFTDESRFCLQHHNGRIHVYRYPGDLLPDGCVMHSHTGPASGIIVWSGIGFHCHTPLIRIAGALNSQHYISEVLENIVLPYIQRLPSAIFQKNNARPRETRNVQEFFLSISLNCFFGLLVLPIYHQSKTFGPCLHNDWPGIHHPLLHRINFVNMWKPLGLMYPKDTS